MHENCDADSHFLFPDVVCASQSGQYFFVSNSDAVVVANTTQTENNIPTYTSKMFTTAIYLTEERVFPFAVIRHDHGQLNSCTSSNSLKLSNIRHIPNKFCYPMAGCTRLGELPLSLARTLFSGCFCH